MALDGQQVVAEAVILVELVDVFGEEVVQVDLGSFFLMIFHNFLQ